MVEKREGIFKQVYKAWRKEELLRVGERGIESAHLSVKDHPNLVAPYVRLFAERLYTQLSTAKIAYDMIVSIPTGGDAWARTLAGVTESREDRRVPLLKLKRVRKGIFSLLEEQPAVRPKAKVLVVDDTLYLGGSSHAVMSMLHDADYLVAGIAVPVEMGTVGRDRWELCELPVFSVFNNEFVARMRHAPT